MAGLRLGVEHGASGAVVRLGGELEFGTAAPLRNTLVDLAQQGPSRVVIDLAGVEFIDSTGISVLVQAKQRLEAQGGGVTLRGLNDRVRRVLEISGLVELFDVE